MEAIPAIIFTFLLLFTLLFSGMPIAISLAASGLIGSIMIQGIGAVSQLGDLIWGAVNIWSLLALPGFILMGNLFARQGFGDDLFDTTYKWFSRLSGGPIIASVAMCAMFAFICGSEMAAMATVSNIAMPEVVRRKYDRKLSLGAFCIAGGLAAVIPPSNFMVIYAAMAQVSLGDMFFAGIVPGLVLAVMISAYVFIRVKLNPDLVPAGPRFSWREKVHSLKSITPVALTFFLVLGGIYLGIWSPIEAAASGAVIALLVGIVCRRFSWRGFLESMKQTIRITGMIFILIIGATFLNNFVYVSGFDRLLVASVTGWGLPDWGVIILILAAMTVLGCFLDVMPLLILSISTFLPVVVACGHDPVWFGIILIIQVELALVTPPVGVNLFIIKTFAPKDTKTSEIALGVFPYILVVWAFFALAIFFPKVITWLPGLL